MPSSKGISAEHQHRSRNGPTRLSLGQFWSRLSLSVTHTRKQTFISWRRCNAGMLDTPASTSAQIGWDTLQERSAMSRLPMQFRIAHNLVDTPAADHLQTYNSRKGNAVKFRVPNARTVAYRHSFFLDATRMLNALPPDMVTTDSLDVFKTDSLFTIRVQSLNTLLSLYNIFISSITLIF